MARTLLPAVPEPLALPGSWQHLAQTDDIDAHAAAQPQWRQEYQQLSGGAFAGRVHHLQLPGLRLVREDSRCALRQRGDLGRGAYGFATPLAAADDAIFDGQRAGIGSVMVGSGDELDLVTPPRFSLIAAVVDAELLEPLWERMYQRPLAAWLESRLVVRLRPAAAQAVQALHLAALDPVALKARSVAALLPLRDAVLMEWIEALPEAVDDTRVPTLAARKRLVDQACERMLARPDAPLSMLELCRQLGTSRRKLNYCFQDVLGTSPLKYLRAVRLNGVRRELRDGAPSVQDAAARWGFWHPGQFSQDYKRLFGELPSVTARMARESPEPLAAQIR